MSLTIKERVDTILAAMAEGVEPNVTPEIKAELESRGYFVEGNQIIDTLTPMMRRMKELREERRAEAQAPKSLGYDAGLDFVNSPAPIVRNF